LWCIVIRPSNVPESADSTPRPFSFHAVRGCGIFEEDDDAEIIAQEGVDDCKVQ